MLIGTNQSSLSCVVCSCSSRTSFNVRGFWPAGCAASAVMRTPNVSSLCIDPRKLLSLSAGLLETMSHDERQPLIAGRDFRLTDLPPRLDASKQPLPGAGIVNEAFARAYFNLPVVALIKAKDRGTVVAPLLALIGAALTAPRPPLVPATRIHPTETLRSE